MVYVCFSLKGNASALNNNGVGYKEKLTSRFRDQGEDAALYLEAMAIVEVKSLRPEFKIYVVDGTKHTPEQLAFNLMNNAPSFGPVDTWLAFVNDGCKEDQGKDKDKGIAASNLATATAPRSSPAQPPASPAQCVTPARTPVPSTQLPPWSGLCMEEMAKMPRYKSFSKLAKKFPEAKIREAMLKVTKPSVFTDDEMDHFFKEYNQAAAE